MGTDLRRGLPVEVDGRRYLLIEVPTDADDATAGRSDDQAVRLLVERVQALARDLGRVERERDALAEEVDRLRGAVVPAPAALAERAAVRHGVEDSWTTPRLLRARRTAAVPARIRWPAWRH